MLQHPDGLFPAAGLPGTVDFDRDFVGASGSQSQVAVDFLPVGPVQLCLAGLAHLGIRQTLHGYQLPLLFGYQRPGQAVGRFRPLVARLPGVAQAPDGRLGIAQQQLSAPQDVISGPLRRRSLPPHGLFDLPELPAGILQIFADIVQRLQVGIHQPQLHPGEQSDIALGLLPDAPHPADFPGAEQGEAQQGEKHRRRR